MGFVIDSNIIVEAERNREGLSQLLQNAPNSECFLSVISVSELLHGVERANSPLIRRQRSLFLESLISQVRILNIDEETARTHAVLWAELLSRGTMIGIHDLWIAATCLRYGHELITSNSKEFARIENLRVRSPSDQPRGSRV